MLLKLIYEKNGAMWDEDDVILGVCAIESEREKMRGIIEAR